MFYFTLSFPASLDNQDINKWQGGLQEKGHKMFITHDPVTCMQHCTNVVLKHERYIVQLEKYQPIFFLSLNGFFGHYIQLCFLLTPHVFMSGELRISPVSVSALYQYQLN